MCAKFLAYCLGLSAKSLKRILKIVFCTILFSNLFQS